MFDGQSVHVSLHVCMLITTVIPTKMAEPIEMGPGYPRGGGNFGRTNFAYITQFTAARDRDKVGNLSERMVLLVLL